MSDKRKSKSYSKEVEDKIDRDLDESIKRRRPKRAPKITEKRSERNEKPNKKAQEASKKDLDHITLDIPSKATNQLFKAAGMPTSSKLTKLSCTISYLVK